MDHHDECRVSEPLPRYAGEDTRLTSKKELWGWYSYGFAAEVFVVCGIGTLFPNVLLFFCTGYQGWGGRNGCHA